MKTIIPLLTTIFMLVAGCASTTQIAETTAEKPADNVTAVDTTEVIDSLQEQEAEQQPNYEHLLEQAKVHYANALLSIYDNDTTAARYEFNHSLQQLRQLQDSDTIAIWIEDETILLSQKVSEDILRYLDNSAEEAQGDYSPTSIQERISLLQPVEEIDWEAGDFTVLDDRDGHIPIIINTRVRQIIKFFQNRGHKDFQVWLNRMNRFQDLFTGILNEYDLPPELFYLAMIESGLNPNAYSYAYAAGPWQFISSTGKLYGLERNWWIDERRDPVKSTHAAAKYMTKLYDEFQDWYLAMAAYNTGERRVWRAIRREQTRDFWSLRTLPRQTRNYVPTFLAAVIIAHHPEKYGFTIQPESKWDPDTLMIKKSYDLNKVAAALSVPANDLKALNPEIRRWISPPNDDNYVLKLPKGTKHKFATVKSDIPESGVQDFADHRVRYGETLSTIAGRYHVSVGSIVSANNIHNRHRIKVGQRLVIPIAGSHSSYASQSSSSKKTSSVPGREKVVYLVKRGDTLGAIAEIYNTRANNIRKWNGLRYGEYIYPGQRLNIWVPEGLASSETHTAEDGTNYRIYVVQRGDTLWEIARRNGVDVNRLKSWNLELASGYLKPGDKIKIMVN